MDSNTRRQIKKHWTYKKLMKKEGTENLDSNSLLNPFRATNSIEESIEKMFRHRRSNRTLFVEYCAHAISCEHGAWLRMSKRFKSSGDKAHCLNEAIKTRQVLQSLKQCIKFLKEPSL